MYVCIAFLDYASLCTATSVPVIPVPYITLDVTEGVDALTVPSEDDAVSAVVLVPMGFPFGNFIHTAVYVSPSAFGGDITLNT